MMDILLDNVNELSTMITNCFREVVSYIHIIWKKNGEQGNHYGNKRTEKIEMNVNL